MKIYLNCISFFVLITILVICEAKSFEKYNKRSPEFQLQERANKVKRGNYHKGYNQDDEDTIIIEDGGRRGNNRDNSLLYLLPFLFGNRGSNSLFGGRSSGLF